MAIPQSIYYMKNNTRTQIVIERHIVIILCLYSCVFVCVCVCRCVWIYFGWGPNNRVTRSLGRSWIVNNVGEKKSRSAIFLTTTFIHFEKRMPTLLTSPTIHRSTWLGHQYRYFTSLLEFFFMFSHFSL